MEDTKRIEIKGVALGSEEIVKIANGVYAPSKIDARRLRAGQSDGRVFLSPPSLSPRGNYP